MSNQNVSSGPDRSSPAFRAEVECFRTTLRQLATAEEFVRATMIVGQIRMNLICPYVDDAEIFHTVYGQEGARRFWEVQLSEPIEIPQFAELLAITAATADNPTGGTPQSREDKKDRWRAAVLAAVFDAFKARETWFVGDTSPMAQAMRWQDVASTHDLKIQGRLAAEWLLRMPKRRHLVPTTLRDFLRLPPDLAPTRPGPGGSPGPTQDEVNKWMLTYYQTAAAKGRQPKRGEEAFPDCRCAIHATDPQMRLAMKQVPESLKRKRGTRDRL